MVEKALDMKTQTRHSYAVPGIESWCRSAGSSGGDFVMRHATDQVLTTVIADATGHDEQAAEVVSYIRPIIARELKNEITPALLRRWHKLVYRRFNNDNRFVCITLLQLDLATQMLTIVNAGNPDVLVHRGTSPNLERFSSTGMPLGLLDCDEWCPPQIQKTYLRHTDYAVCFTDGVVDCLNAAGARFGLSRIYSAVQTASLRSPMRAVRRGLLRFWSPEADQDDLSILVLRGRHRCVA
jgi:serine phosphatase RsbU (regulator of sigma subunit)